MVIVAPAIWVTAAMPPAANWVAAASRFALQVAAAGVAGMSAAVICGGAATCLKEGCKQIRGYGMRLHTNIRNKRTHGAIHPHCRYILIVNIERLKIAQKAFRVYSNRLTPPIGDRHHIGTGRPVELTDRLIRLCVFLPPCQSALHSRTRTRR